MGTKAEIEISNNNKIETKNDLDETIKWLRTKIFGKSKPRKHLTKEELDKLAEELTPEKSDKLAKEFGF